MVYARLDVFLPPPVLTGVRKEESMHVGIVSCAVLVSCYRAEVDEYRLIVRLLRHCPIFPSKTGCPTTFPRHPLYKNFDKD